MYIIYKENSLIVKKGKKDKLYCQKFCRLLIMGFPRLPKIYTSKKLTIICLTISNCVKRDHYLGLPITVYHGKPRLFFFTIYRLPPIIAHLQNYPPCKGLYFVGSNTPIFLC